MAFEVRWRLLEQSQPVVQQLNQRSMNASGNTSTSNNESIPNSEPNQQHPTSNYHTMVKIEDISKIWETMKELRQDMEMRRSLPNCASKEELQNLKQEISRLKASHDEKDTALRRGIDQIRALNDEKDKEIQKLKQINDRLSNENVHLKNLHQQELRNLNDKNENLIKFNAKFSLQLDILMKQMDLPEDQRNFSLLREKIDELKRAYANEKQNAALEKDRADYLALNVPMNDSNVLELNPHLG